MSLGLAIGFSPCPNDTFMFHALVTGAVEGPAVVPWLADIEALNERAIAGVDPLPVTKLSVHALAHVAGRYVPLATGAALGRGCGPLVVARPGVLPTEPRAALQALAGLRVAIPGRYTTAQLLLRSLAPAPRETVQLRFEAILPAVADGSVDAGLIIHESRFTYAQHGLVAAADLGVLWEEETGLPLPLGVIAVLRERGEALARALELGIGRRSRRRGPIRRRRRATCGRTRRRWIRRCVDGTSRCTSTSSRARWGARGGRRSTR
jgi:1,4-dihydroxy-6-naphthoate synthase